MGIFIPDGVIEDILTRLPARDLLRFQLLSKHWYHLINSSNCKFLRKNLSHVKDQAEIIFLVREPKYRMKYVSIDMQEKTIPDMLSQSLESFRVKKNYSLSSLSGLALSDSCDGILLFCDPLSVYNPLTGKFKDLPDIKFAEPCVSLAYDTLHDTYKVFALGICRDRGLFCTLKADESWRELENSLVVTNPGEKCRMSSYNFLFDRSELNWMIEVYNDDGAFIQYLFTMDVQKEMFRKAEVPINNGGKVPHLSKFRGILCITTLKDNALYVEGLEMNDSTRTYQWTAISKFSLAGFPSRGLTIFHVPTSNSEDGRDLFKLFVHSGEDKLFFYDHNSNAYHDIGNISSKNVVKAFLYHVNSLVSWE